jgi:hypothetical protein
MVFFVRVKFGRSLDDYESSELCEIDGMAMQDVLIPTKVRVSGHKGEIIGVAGE